MAYISKYDDDVHNAPNAPNADYEDKIITHSGRKKATKSRRVHILMTPELHSDMLTLAYMERVSLNEFVNRLMEEYVASKQDRINKYSTFMEEN